METKAKDKEFDESVAASTDRIEKRIVLRAERARVWRAITNSEEFGAWFGVKLQGSFEAGATVHGRITSPGCEHMTLDMFVERVEPEELFSYRWHPYGIDVTVDYSGEPTTLVEFRLDEMASGTLLTMVESGFDQIPLGRRAEAFRMHNQGWTQKQRPCSLPWAMRRASGSLRGSVGMDLYPALA